MQKQTNREEMFALIESWKESGKTKKQSASVRLQRVRQKNSKSTRYK